MPAHETLAQSVADLLRDQIAAGTLAAGARLVELSLAHELAVSQNTVRDALALLEAEGWVVRRPRLGTSVRQFTPAEADDTRLMLDALTHMALDAALPQISRGQLAEARRRLVDARKRLRDADAPGAMRHLYQFHDIILKAAALERPLLVATLRRLYVYAQLIGATGATTYERTAGLVVAHDALAIALDKGDADGARAALAAVWAAWG